MLPFFLNATKQNDPENGLEYKINVNYVIEIRQTAAGYEAVMTNGSLFLVSDTELEKYEISLKMYADDGERD